MPDFEIAPLRVEIREDFEAQTAASVGYGVDGNPMVHLRRLVLDGLEVQLLRKAAWQVTPLLAGH